MTGVSGSGKSSLVSQALVELVAEALGHELPVDEEDEPAEREAATLVGGRIVEGARPHPSAWCRWTRRPIGRTPRSNLATYTGLFDHVRKLFAATPAARARRYDAGRFSFNVAKGRCAHCEGEGFVMVELLFLASVYAPCPVCQGSRYDARTLEVLYRGRNIAEVLALTVDEAAAFFADEPPVRRALDVLQEVGLGYLRLGQPATELSGGEAQRIKLAAELQSPRRGHSLYVLDEPTTGLHPADVERLMEQLAGLVDAGNTVVVVEHDMRRGRRQRLGDRRRARAPATKAAASSSRVRRTRSRPPRRAGRPPTSRVCSRRRTPDRAPSSRARHVHFMPPA